MIRITQVGEAPASLINGKSKHLPKIRERTLEGTLCSDDFDSKSYRTDEIKTRLWKQQHHKCCYCERKIPLSYNDVEHFRPKTSANRKPGSSNTTGYWWLAWTWENLLFACPLCNRSHKKDNFPLREGSPVLQAEDPPPGSERPLLLNPAEESGIPYIEHRLIGDRWQIFARKKSREAMEAGITTIGVLGLNHDDLAELYRAHVEHMSVDLEKLRSALDREDRDQLLSVWSECIRRHITRGAEHVGLSYDVLQQTVSPEEQRRYGLPPLPTL